jgi:hypothetical protein
MSQADSPVAGPASPRRVGELKPLVTTTLVFLPLPLIGTLAHECGHAAVASLRGYNPTIHFGSTDWATAAGVPPNEGDDLAILLGGPCTDVLIGTAGLIWLAATRRNVESNAPLRPQGWSAAVMALFWSRPVFVALRLFAALAEHFGLPAWLIASGTGMLGAAVCWIVVTRYIPARTSLHFALGGVIGSIAGFALWHGWLGPLLLP